MLLTHSAKSRTVLLAFLALLAHVGCRTSLLPGELTNFESNAGATAVGATGGSSNQPGSAGRSGHSSGAVGGIAVAGAGGSGGSAAVDPDPLRSRWLSVQTFLSSASSQTLAHLIGLDIDIEHPGGVSFQVEAESANEFDFSPDGRFFTYVSHRGEHDAHTYLIDISGELPTKAKLLFKSAGRRPCGWSKDSRKLACVKQTSSDIKAAADVVYFDMSTARPGPEVRLGAFASNAHFLDGLYWLDEATLVFSGEQTLTKIIWQGDSFSSTNFAAPGGAIVDISPNGRRGLIAKLSDFKIESWDNQARTFWLVDFRSGESRQLPAHYHWEFSDSLEAAIASEPATKDKPGERHYYLVEGTELIGPVHKSTAESVPSPWSRPWQRPAKKYSTWVTGTSWIYVSDGGPTLVKIDDSVIGERSIPGSYSSIYKVRLSPDKSWLYLASAKRASDNKLMPENAEHAVVRFLNGRPVETQLLAKGYLADEAEFSPSSPKLMLRGPGGSPDSTTLRIYDLSGIDTFSERVLDQPFRARDNIWSPDATYIAFRGGSPGLSLWVADLIDEKRPLMEFFRCSGNPATLPGCVNGAVFAPIEAMH